MRTQVRQPQWCCLCRRGPGWTSMRDRGRVGDEGLWRWGVGADVTARRGRSRAAAGGRSSRCACTPAFPGRPSRGTGACTPRAALFPHLAHPLPPPLPSPIPTSPLPPSRSRSLSFSRVSLSLLLLLALVPQKRAHHCPRRSPCPCPWAIGSAVVLFLVLHLHLF